MEAWGGVKKVGNGLLIEGLTKIKKYMKKLYRNLWSSK